MKTVLCYGDSNTWGFVPDPAGPPEGADGRYRADVRWTGQLQKLLGQDWRVIEEGFNGRTTVYDEPGDPGKRGIDFLPVCISSHSPLDVLILMLGTNDTKPIFHASPWYISAGLEALVRAALDRELNCMQPLSIIVACPAPLGDRMAQSWLYGIFDEDSVAKSKQLAPHYERIAGLYGAAFVDAGAAVSVHPQECVHLTAESHGALARLFYDTIRGLA